MFLRRQNEKRPAASGENDRPVDDHPGSIFEGTERSVRVIAL
jgi:hypothetical protein